MRRPRPHRAPRRPPHPPAVQPPVRAPAPPRVARSPARSSSVARPPSSRSPTAVAEAFKEQNPGLRLHGRGSRHRRRLQEVLRRRDRHQRRLAQDQGRGGRRWRVQDRRHRVHRAEGRHRRHLGDDLTQQHAVTCLSFADLYALIGPESTGFAKWSDAARARQGARLQHDLPRCRPDDHRPGRGVGHVRQLRRARPRPRGADPRQDRPGDQAHVHATRLHGSARTTTRSSRASPAPTRRSAGWASPSPRRTRTRSRRDPGREGCQRDVRRPDRRDHRRR